MLQEQIKEQILGYPQPGTLIKVVYGTRKPKEYVGKVVNYNGKPKVVNIRGFVGAEFETTTGKKILIPWTSDTTKVKYYKIGGGEIV